MDSNWHLVQVMLDAVLPDVKSTPLLNTILGKSVACDPTGANSIPKRRDPRVPLLIVTVSKSLSLHAGETIDEIVQLSWVGKGSVKT